MSFICPDSPRILVQGITGREASMVVAHMNAYGTPVTAGVTPGKQGSLVDGVPVFDTIDGARAATGGNPFDVGIVYVPPLAALDAVGEAVAAGMKLLVVVTENIPVHDSVRIRALTCQNGTTMVGPNSVGLIAPRRRLKLGAIGGDNPDRSFVPGSVGVISRSGGLTAEVGLQLRIRDGGVSTAISIGGDALIGLEPAAAAIHLDADPLTQAIVYVGEPGTRMEERLAETLASGHITKPVVCLILGEFIEEFPEGTVFGHAGAVIERGRGSAREKKRNLSLAGAIVVETFDDLIAEALSRSA